MHSLAEQIIHFNENLKYSGKLPDGYAVLNPFFDNPETMTVMRQFYEKYYSDNRPVSYTHLDVYKRQLFITYL